MYSKEDFKTIRHQMHLKQRDMAAKLGTNPTYLGEIERGYRPITHELSEALFKLRFTS